MTAKILRSDIWNRVYEETLAAGYRDNRVFIQVNRYTHSINRDVWAITKEEVNDNDSRRKSK